VYCFEQKIAKSRWDSTLKGKSRARLEIWCKPTPVASFAAFREDFFFETAARSAATSAQPRRSRPTLFNQAVSQITLAPISEN
jgi:hypothetical protein